MLGFAKLLLQYIIMADNDYYYWKHSNVCHAQSCECYLKVVILLYLFIERKVAKAET